MVRLLLILSLYAAGVAHSATLVLAEDALTEAEIRYRQKKYAEAARLVTSIIERDGNHFEALRLRSACYQAERQFGRAIKDLDRCIKLEPDVSRLYQQRGEMHFRNGDVEESIRDFDHFLDEDPSQDPYHWQRGISYYYAGRYAEGVGQFERHKAVNPQDVENSVWHFLCKSRVDGVEKARQALIEIERDPRPWALSVYRLFQKKSTPEQVIRQAAQTTPESRRNDSLFYAHLYVGLYYESLQQGDKSLKHIKEAVARYPAPHYMGDVARVHLKLRQAVDTE